MAGRNVETSKRRNVETKWMRFVPVFIGIFACVILWQCGGCLAPDKAEVALSYLERGKADGHLTVTSDAGLEVGETVSFFAGARGTRIAFDGNIDFSEAPAEPPRWAGQPASKEDDSLPGGG